MAALDFQSTLKQLWDAIKQIRTDVIELKKLERPAINSGSAASKPASGTKTGQRYFATDTGSETFWGNSRWATMQEYTAPIPLTVLSANGTVQANLTVGNLLLTKLELFVSQANNGTTTNYWSWTLSQFGGINGGTIDTKTQTAGTPAGYSYTNFTTNPSSGATQGRAVLNFTQNNVAAGNLTVWGLLTYRKVG